MTQKNQLKAERKSKRKPPIPYTKVGTTKQDIVNKLNKKAKEKYYED